MFQEEYNIYVPHEHLSQRVWQHVLVQLQRDTLERAHIPMLNTRILPNMLSKKACGRVEVVQLHEVYAYLLKQEELLGPAQQVEEGEDDVE